MAPNGNGEPAYTVTSQQETVDLGPAGNYLNGVRVSFRTRLGALGSVFIPTPEYEPGRVKALLAERAAAMDDVHASGGEG